MAAVHHATSSSRPPADPPAPLLIGARRLAPLLGVAVRTVRKLDAVGGLPSPVRIGGRVVWRIDEIRDWIDAGAPDREAWAVLRAAKKK